jgi:hypothetical protein
MYLIYKGRNSIETIRRRGAIVASNCGAEQNTRINKLYSLALIHFPTHVVSSCTHTANEISPNHISVAALAKGLLTRDRTSSIRIP